MAVVVVVAVALSGSSVSAESPVFDDVPADHLFHDEIAWAADLGIANGYGDGTFGPTMPVTRQAAVAFLHRLWVALGGVAGDPPPDPGFSDVPAGHPFYDDIAWAADLGIANGYSDGTFGPTMPVTRQAMAAFLYRLADTFGLWLLVDTAVDAIDVAPGDGFCDIGDGTCSLRAAIDEANASAGLDVVTIASGIDPVLALAHTAEDTNADGDLHVTDDLTINGAGATINADGIAQVIDNFAGQLTITNTTITGGTGGIHNHANLTLTGSTIDDNPGGGVYNEGNLTITDSTITNNTARGINGGLGGQGAAGGGIYNDDGIVIVTNSTISGNVTTTQVYGDGWRDDRGGGIYNEGELTITNSTVSNNAASMVGGIYSNYGTLTITNSTITNNTTSSLNGGIYNKGGVATVSSTVVAGNSGDCAGAVTSGGYNLDLDGSCGFSDPTDLASSSALLWPLVDNGGPTLTRLPSAASPLVDAIPAGANGCGTTMVADQRGVARPDGAGCDIGATEGAGPAAAPLDLAVDTAIDAVDISPGDGVCDIGDGTCSLRAAVQETNAWPAADVITIGAGIDPVLTIGGAYEDSSATGDLDTVGSLTINAEGATIDADGIDRVIDHHAGQLTITDATLTGGLSTEDGGGIYNHAGTLTLTATTITDNQTYEYGQGGGIYNRGALTVANSTITNNRVSPSWEWAIGAGGGIYTTGPDAATITNTTVAANSALYGGGIYRGGGAVTVLSTVVASNPGGDCSGTVVSGGYNLDSDGSCGFADPTDLVPQDPLLGPLADNGGPTLTRLPSAVSPLVDAIPAGANGCGATVVSDQRGQPRPHNGGCDIGAVERQAADP